MTQPIVVRTMYVRIRRAALAQVQVSQTWEAEPVTRLTLPSGSVEGSPGRTRSAKRTILRNCHTRHTFKTRQVAESAVTIPTLAKQPWNKEESKMLLTSNDLLNQLHKCTASWHWYGQVCCKVKGGYL